MGGLMKEVEVCAAPLSFVWGRLEYGGNLIRHIPYSAREPFEVCAIWKLLLLGEPYKVETLANVPPCTK